MFKLDLEKAEEPEIKLPASIGSSKKQENTRKIPAFLITPKPLTVWITTNCGKFFKVVLEKTLESPLDSKIKPVHPKGNQSWTFFGRNWCWNSKTLATWWEELTHWKRSWCWERLKAGGEGNDRGWDVWMASLTRWTWVWACSASWWWTGKPGVLQSKGLRRVGHNWATKLNWCLSLKIEVNN